MYISKFVIVCLCPVFLLIFSIKSSYIKNMKYTNNGICCHPQPINYVYLKENKTIHYTCR